jgi:hypothetical protein
MHDSSTLLKVTAVAPTAVFVGRIRYLLLGVGSGFLLIYTAYSSGELYFPGLVDLVIFGGSGLSALCLLDLFMTLRKFSIARKLDREGILAKVTMTRKYQVEIDTHIHPFNPKIPYYFLEYQLPDGTPIRIAIDRQVFAALEGNQVFVTYLAQTPQVQRVSLI